jgi:hypothetical protein
MHLTRAKPTRKKNFLILSKTKVVEDGECFVKEEEVRRELQGRVFTLGKGCITSYPFLH